MAENPKKPRKDDVVLGGQNPAPVSGVVLGGLEGVKWRLASADVEQQVAALKDALEYGESGLELVIDALNNESAQVNKYAYWLLREREESKVKQAIREYNPWQFMVCIHTISLDSYRNIPTARDLTAISSDGKTLVTGIFKEILVWDLSAEKVKHTIEVHSRGVNSVAISPDSQTIISGGYNGTIKFWDLQTGKLKRTLKRQSEPVDAIFISFDSQILVSQGWHNSTIPIKALDWSTGRIKCVVNENSHGCCLLSAVSPDGQTLFTSFYEKSIRMWNLLTGQLKGTIDNSEMVVSLAVSPDNQTLVIGSSNKTIKLWDLPTGQFKRILSGNSSPSDCLAISQDNEILVSVDGHTIKVWDWQTGNVLCHLNWGRHYSADPVVVSQDGQTIVGVSSWDKTIKVWGVR